MVVLFFLLCERLKAFFMQIFSFLSLAFLINSGFMLVLHMWQLLWLLLECLFHFYNNCSSLSWIWQPLMLLMFVFVNGKQPFLFLLTDAHLLLLLAFCCPYLNLFGLPDCQLLIYTSEFSDLVNLTLIKSDQYEAFSSCWLTRMHRKLIRNKEKRCHQIAVVRKQRNFKCQVVIQQATYGEFRVNFCQQIYCQYAVHSCVGAFRNVFKNNLYPQYCLFSFCYLGWVEILCNKL